MNDRTFAVVGAGLIGGSIARELAARGARVLIRDRDAATQQAALSSGVAAAALPASLEGVEAADALFIAVPVGADVDLLDAAAGRLTGVPLILNAASVQRPSADAAVRVGLAARYVGTHPLAGDHRSGWHASRIGLFADARVMVCPTASTTPEAVARARRIWSSFGAATELLDARTHDERLAWISHLPQAMASALGAALARAGVPVTGLGPGGLDTTRLAASAPAVWTPILMANAEVMTDALAAAGAAVRELADALARRDTGAVASLLGEAMHWRTGAAADGSVSDPA